MKHHLQARPLEIAGKEVEPSSRIVPMVLPLRGVEVLLVGMYLHSGTGQEEANTALLTTAMELTHRAQRPALWVGDSTAPRMSCSVWLQALLTWA